MGLTAIVTLVLATACSTTTKMPKASVGKSPHAVGPSSKLAGPPGLEAVELASLESPDAPVAFAMGPKGGLFAYVQGGRLFARAVSPGPTSSGEAVALGNAGVLGVAFSVRPRADGTFIVFWGERVDQNHVFKAQRVGADGKPIGQALAMPPVADAGVTFADVAILGDRALVVHEVSRGDRISVYVTPIASAFDKFEGASKPVVEGALAWYPAESEAGLGIVTVVEAPSGAESTDPTPQSGLLQFMLVDPSGKAGAKKPVGGTQTAQIDAQIAAVQGGYVVAWTDEAQDDGAVRVATLSKDGTVVGQPSWVAPPIGQQAFVSLAADPSGRGARALVAWENVGQASGTARIIHLATVDAKGTIAPERTRMLYADSDRPALVADGDGFAALTLAPAMANEETQSAETPSYPTLVRLGPDLSVRWSEPVRFGGALARDGVPAFAWNPTCAASSCYALAADGPGPTAFYVASSADRASPWKPPAWRADEERSPKVLGLRSMAEGPRLASADATKLGADGPEAVAWVTYFLEGANAEAAPKGEPPYAATLGVRFTTADGKPSEPVIVSKRALSLGGVSVAPAPGGKKSEAVVAWVASDKGGPQVFATKVDVDGKKVAQKKVTTVTRSGAKSSGKGGDDHTLYASSVAIAPSPIEGDKSGSDGLVLAWVDTRDKNGELYVARLNKDLEKSVPDKRITNAAGDASDVSIAVRGSDTFIAFADAREGKPSDIYFSHLDAFSLKEKDDDGRVYASAGRSRAPHIALAGSKIILAWIEEDAAAEAKPATLRVAEVDTSGRLIQPPRTLEAPGGASITGFGLSCGDTIATCRLALSWGTADGRTEIGAVTLDASGAPSAVRRLGTLASGPYAEPSFTFGDRAATSLYYAEDLGDRGRLRQLKLGW
ncbi:MAG: hypothetical protein HOW73_17590 [Polyangiaceae bacterium]|nr:hypothetical protein [Polyangiaceae bacterium]